MYVAVRNAAHSTWRFDYKFTDYTSKQYIEFRQTN